MARPYRCPYCGAIAVQRITKGGYCRNCRLIILELTRRDFLQPLRDWNPLAPWISALCAVVSVSVLFHDRLRRKSSLSVAVHEKIHTTDVMIAPSHHAIVGHVVVHTGVHGSMIFEPATVPPMEPLPHFRSIVAQAPVEFRRAVWDARVHAKRRDPIAIGRFRFNRLKFPKAPEKWA